MSEDAAHVVDMSDPLAALRQKLAEETAAAMAAKASVSKDDQAEIELRDQIAQQREERERVEAQRRELALARRYDAAKAAHPEWHIGKCVIPEYGDTFLVRHNARAFSDWQKGIASSVTDKGFDRVKNERDYVVRCVIDWNGMDLSSDMSPDGHKLIAYLTEHPGIVSTLAGVAADLGGVVLNARKS